MKCLFTICFVLTNSILLAQGRFQLSNKVSLDFSAYRTNLSQSVYLNFGNDASGEEVSVNKVTPEVSQAIVEVDKRPDAQLKASTSGSNYYGLFIGIDDYQFNNAALVDLDNPIRDASNLRSVLIESYLFEPANAVILKNPTREDIIQALENLAISITSNDNLLIFYAGHGLWDERLNVGYWLPSNAEVGNKSNWISNSTVRDYIAGIDSKHTLLITDACFSGSIFKSRSVGLTGLAMYNLYKMPSRKAMTSGHLSAVPDDSKFMYYLLKRLEENDSQFVSSSQLFSLIQAAVMNNTMTVPQFGVIQNAGDEGGDFIFRRK